MDNKKEKKKKNIPFRISLFIFIIGVIGLCLYFVKTRTEEDKFGKVRKLKEDSPDDKKEELGYYLINGEVVQEGLKDVYIENTDTIGWLTIDDTAIDYPVMYTPDDEQFYIHRGFDKEYSFAGCIFAGEGADVTNPSNMILYGHHMISQTMFKPLDNYMDEEYYKKHKYIKFDTLRQTGTYEVIAAIKTKIYYYEKDGFMYYTYTDLSSKSEFDKFIKNCDELKLYDTDATAEYGDELVTLSTCAYHTYNGRFIVVAKRIDGLEVNTDKDPIRVITIEEETEE